MLLDALGARGLLFTGGKGGVGKTTSAAILAVAAAGRGERVLLVSTDPAHNLGHIFEREVGPRPVRVAEGLEALELDPEETVAAHLAEVGATLKRLMPPGTGDEVARHMERARHAPGMAEAAILARLSDLAAGIGRDHDRMIVDTAPTGHTLALLQLPEMMTAWTDGLLANRAEHEAFSRRARELAGASETPRDRNTEIRAILHRRKERLAALRARLVDPTSTGFVLVSTPERMPVLETAAMAKSLAGTGIAPTALLVNRVPAGLSAAAVRQRLTPLEAALGAVPRFVLPEGGEEPMGLGPLRAKAAQMLPLGGHSSP